MAREARENDVCGTVLLYSLKGISRLNTLVGRTGAMAWGLGPLAGYATYQRTDYPPLEDYCADPRPGDSSWLCECPENSVARQENPNYGCSDTPPVSGYDYDSVHHESQIAATAMAGAFIGVSGCFITCASWKFGRYLDRRITALENGDAVADAPIPLGNIVVYHDPANGTLSPDADSHIAAIFTGHEEVIKGLAKDKMPEFLDSLVQQNSLLDFLRTRGCGHS